MDAGVSKDGFSAIVAVLASLLFGSVVPVSSSGHCFLHSLGMDDFKWKCGREAARGARNLVARRQNALFNDWKKFSKASAGRQRNAVLPMGGLYSANPGFSSRPRMFSQMKSKSGHVPVWA